jgi:hypothetical protein
MGRKGFLFKTGTINKAGKKRFIAEKKIPAWKLYFRQKLL